MGDFPVQIVELRAIGRRRTDNHARLHGLLRSLGLVQLMMQSGMFVAANSFTASMSRGVFTHLKQEESADMQSGKFDEELARISEVVDHLSSGSLVLVNGSFAATNERKASEVAFQIISGLLDSGVRIVCVTHLYALGGSCWKGQRRTLFSSGPNDWQMAPAPSGLLSVNRCLQVSGAIYTRQFSTRHPRSRPLCLSATNPI